MDRSLGLILLPFIVLLTGWLVHGEKLSKIREYFPASGPCSAWLRAGNSSPASLVFLGYPAYLFLRRRLRTENLGGPVVRTRYSAPELPRADPVACRGANAWRSFGHSPVAPV